MLLETERYVNYSSFDWQYTLPRDAILDYVAHQIEAGRA